MHRTPPFKVQAWHPYTARNARELSLEVGKAYTVVIVEEGRGAWFGAILQGKIVWFPASYTRYPDVGVPIKAPTQDVPLVSPSSLSSLNLLSSQCPSVETQQPMERSATVPYVPGVSAKQWSVVQRTAINRSDLPPQATTLPAADQSVTHEPGVSSHSQDTPSIHRETLNLQSSLLVTFEQNITTTPAGMGEKEGVAVECVSPTVEVMNEEEAAEKAMKDARQRKMTIQEIVATELDYVRDLGILVNMSKLMAEKKLLPAEVMAQIFSNVIVLHGVNCSITTEIEYETANIELLPNGKEGNIDKLPLGKIFLKLAPFLKMYLSYCENHDNALIVLAKHKKKNKYLEQFINQQAETQECKGLYLKDYLIKPIQRLCKYPLLFQNLLKLTPENDEDYKQLKECLDKINAIVRDINEIRDKNVNFSSLFHYEERLVDYHSTLLSRQRKFIREGTLYTIDDKKSRIMHMRKSEAQERVVLLFNDRIIFCKKVFSLGSKTNSLKFSTEMLTDVTRVIDNFKEHTEHDISFMLETHMDTTKTRMIFAENAKEKNIWRKLLQETVSAAKVDMNRREEDSDGNQFDFSSLEPHDPKFGEKEIRALIPILLGPKGIPIKNRKLKLKIYKNCFTGKDLVQWLVSNGVKDKNTAILIGQKFIDFGYVKHASENDSTMKDDTTFYRFDAISMDQDKRTRSTSARNKGQVSGDMGGKSKNEKKNSFGKNSSPPQQVKIGGNQRRMALSPQRNDLPLSKSQPESLSLSSNALTNSEEQTLSADADVEVDSEDDQDNPIPTSTEIDETQDINPKEEEEQ